MELYFKGFIDAGTYFALQIKRNPIIFLTQIVIRIKNKYQIENVE